METGRRQKNQKKKQDSDDIDGNSLKAGWVRRNRGACETACAAGLVEMGSDLEPVRDASAFRGVMDSTPHWKRTSTITFRIDMKVCLWTGLNKPEILSHL